MSKKPFSFPIGRGQFSPQAHVKLPEGTYEEELGREGFFGGAAHLYHQHPPTDWDLVEGDCRPQAYDLNKLEAKKSWQRQRVLFNRNAEISLLLSTEPDPFYFRNADSDEVHFVHEGEGRFECDFGSLRYQTGDYLYIPRCTTYRFLGTKSERRLIIESKNSSFSQPDRGLLGHHALYDPAVLELPEAGPSKTGPTDPKNGHWEVRISRGGKTSRILYKRNPLDVVGYKGDIAAFKLPIGAIRPVVSPRMDLAPSVHSTFVGERFVVCSFVPRPLPEEEGALRVPFFHRNVDFDEVIFYHAGDFFSRDNIRPGWMTFHPTGIHHGPHPKALANQFKKSHTNEYAVMIDTREPLEVDTGGAVAACEWGDYWRSWSSSNPARL